MISSLKNKTDSLKKQKKSPKKSESYSKTSNNTIPNPPNSSATAHLAVPDSKRQHFTYSESKLLDQITIEIMEAWKKDLTTMRKAHQESMKMHSELKSITRLMEEKFPKIEEFLNQEDFLFLIKKMDQRMEKIEFAYNEIHTSLFRLDEKINFSYVSEMMNKINSLVKLVDILEQKVKELNMHQKTKWWKKLF